MEAVFHRLWSVELCGFLLLTTFDILNSHDGPKDSPSLHANQLLGNHESGGSIRQLNAPEFSCNFSASCISVWVVEPKCWNGHLEIAGHGYIQISLNASHCQSHDKKIPEFEVYWLWGSEEYNKKEISRCRHFSVCRIPAQVFRHSSSSKHWLNILLDLNDGSLIGTISVTADYRLSKGNFSLKTTADKQIMKQTNSVVQMNKKHANVKVTSTLRQKKNTDISRNKRAAINEAQDLAALMQGESPEAKERISEMIATDFASGGFKDPAVPTKHNPWSRMQGSNLGSMIRNSVREPEPRAESATAEEIPPSLIKLRQQVKQAEQDVAEAAHDLNIANTKHEANLLEGKSVLESMMRKTKAEKRLQHLTDVLKNMKLKYALANKSLSTGTERKIHGLISLSPMWSEWTSWSKCSVDCGDGGFSVRRRECETIPDSPCSGISFDMRSCSTSIRCEAIFHDWGDWGPCSATCGKGVRARSRVCVTGDKEMRCRGASTVLEKCFLPKCITIVAGQPISGPNGANLVAAPPVAFILGPGMAGSPNVFPPAQSYYRPLSPGDVYGLPPAAAASYYKNYVPLALAGGAGAAAAGDASWVLSHPGVSELSEHPADTKLLLKTTVEEPGKENGPKVVTKPQKPTKQAKPDGKKHEENLKLTPETTLFIVLFLLFILLLIIAFCIYCFKRIGESKIQQKMKETRPFYKPDNGEDDDDDNDDRKQTHGTIKPVLRSATSDSESRGGPMVPASQKSQPKEKAPETESDPETGSGKKKKKKKKKDKTSASLETGNVSQAESKTVEENAAENTPSQIANDDVETDARKKKKKKKKKEKSSSLEKGETASIKSGNSTNASQAPSNASNDEVAPSKTLEENVAENTPSQIANDDVETDAGKKKKKKKKKEKLSSLEKGETASIKSGNSTNASQAPSNASNDEVAPSKTLEENVAENTPSQIANDDVKTDAGKKKKKKKKKEKSSSLEKGETASIKSGNSTNASQASSNASNDEVAPSKTLEENVAENAMSSHIARDDVERKSVNKRLDAYVGRHDYSDGGFLSQHEGSLAHPSNLKSYQQVERQITYSLEPSSHLQYPTLAVEMVPGYGHLKLENCQSEHKSLPSYSLLPYPDCYGSIESTSAEYRIPKMFLSDDFERSDLESGDAEMGPVSCHGILNKYNDKLKRSIKRKRTYQRPKRKMNKYFKSSGSPEFKNMPEGNGKILQFYRKPKRSRFNLTIQKHREKTGTQSGTDRPVKSRLTVQTSSDSSDVCSRDDGSFNTSHDSFHSNTEAVQSFVEKPQVGIIRQIKDRQTVKNHIEPASSSDQFRGHSVHHKLQVSKHPIKLSSSSQSSSAHLQNRTSTLSSLSSSWLSMLLSESDKKLNEIDKDIDTVLKEQCQIHCRSDTPPPSKIDSDKTLQSVNAKNLKSREYLERCQLNKNGIQNYSKKYEKFRNEGIQDGLESETSMAKYLKNKFPSQKLYKADEAQRKHGNDQSQESYEKKKEDILRLLHSTSLYQSRGQSMYYTDPRKPIPLQKTLVCGQVQGGYQYLSSNLFNGEQLKKGNRDKTFVLSEHTYSNIGAPQISQAVFLAGAHQDKLDADITSESSHVPPSSASQKQSTESTESKIHKTFIPLCCESSKTLDEIWQTEKSKILKAPVSVTYSATSDGYVPYSDTCSSKIMSYDTDKTVSILNKEHTEEYKEVDSQESKQGRNFLIFQENKDTKSDYFSHSSDMHCQQTEGIKIVLKTSGAQKEQRDLNKHISRLPCKSLLDRNERHQGSRNQSYGSQGSSNQNDESRGSRNQNDESRGSRNQNDESRGSRNQNDESRGSRNQNDESRGSRNQNDESRSSRNQNDESQKSRYDSRGSCNQNGKQFYSRYKNLRFQQREPIQDPVLACGHAHTINSCYTSDVKTISTRIDDQRQNLCNDNQRNDNDKYISLDMKENTALVTNSYENSVEKHTIFLQNNDKQTHDQVFGKHEKDNIYEHILDKQLEDFVDSTSWISSKDYSKIQVEWNTNRDSKRKQFKMFQRSITPHDTDLCSLSSTLSEMTLMRIFDSKETKPKESMFNKCNTMQAASHDKHQQRNQSDRDSSVYWGKKHIPGKHNAKFGQVSSQTSYQSFPESSVSTKAIEQAGFTSFEDFTATEAHKAEACDSFVSLSGKFSTPGSQISWRTAKTDESVYKSLCKSDASLYETTMSGNSKVPCSLNSTFSLDSAESINNSVASDIETKTSNMSAYHGLNTECFLSANSNDTADVPNFRDAISADNTLFNVSTSANKKSLRNFDSNTSKDNSSGSQDAFFCVSEQFKSRYESIDGTFSFPDTTNTNSLFYDSEEQKITSKHEQIPCPCSEPVIQDIFSVSGTFSFPDTTKTNSLLYDSEEQKITSKHEQIPCPCSESVIQDIFSVSVVSAGKQSSLNSNILEETSKDNKHYQNQQTRGRSPPESVKTSLRRTAKDGANVIQALDLLSPCLSAQNVSIQRYDNGGAEIMDSRPYQLPPYGNNLGGSDEYESEVNLTSSVEETDAKAACCSATSKLDTTYIMSPEWNPLWTGRTDLTDTLPCSLFMAKGMESSIVDLTYTDTVTGFEPRYDSHDNRQHRRDKKVKSYGNDKMFAFDPIMGSNLFLTSSGNSKTNSCQNYCRCENCTASSFDDISAGIGGQITRPCHILSGKMSKEYDVPKNKQTDELTEIEYKEYYVPGSITVGTNTSMQSHKEGSNDLSKVTKTNSVHKLCKWLDVNECERFINEKTENSQDNIGHNVQSFAARLDVTTEFYKRAIQWSPLLDRKTDLGTNVKTTSVFTQQQKFYSTGDVNSRQKHTDSEVSAQETKSHSVQSLRLGHNMQDSSLGFRDKTISQCSQILQTEICSVAPRETSEKSSKNVGKTEQSSSGYTIYIMKKEECRDSKQTFTKDCYKVLDTSETNLSKNVQSRLVTASPASNTSHGMPMIPENRHRSVASDRSGQMYLAGLESYHLTGEKPATIVSENGQKTGINSQKGNLETIENRSCFVMRKGSESEAGLKKGLCTQGAYNDMTNNFKTAHIIDESNEVNRNLRRPNSLNLALNTDLTITVLKVPEVDANPQIIIRRDDSLKVNSTQGRTNSFNLSQNSDLTASVLEVPEVDANPQKTICTDLSLDVNSTHGRTNSFKQSLNSDFTLAILEVPEENADPQKTIHSDAGIKVNSTHRKTNSFNLSQNSDPTDFILEFPDVDSNLQKTFHTPYSFTRSDDCGQDTNRTSPSSFNNIQKKTTDLGSEGSPLPFSGVEKSVSLVAISSSSETSFQSSQRSRSLTTDISKCDHISQMHVICKTTIRHDSSDITDSDYSHIEYIKAVIPGSSNSVQSSIFDDSFNSHSSVDNNYFSDKQSNSSHVSFKEKTCFSAEKLSNSSHSSLDEKTCFSAEKLSNSSHSSLDEKTCSSAEKLSNSSHSSLDEKTCFSAEKLSNSWHSSLDEKTCFSAEKPSYSSHSSLDEKTCFSAEKTCFSAEKPSYSSHSSLADKTCFFAENFSSNWLLSSYDKNSSTIKHSYNSHNSSDDKISFSAEKHDCYSNSSSVEQSCNSTASSSSNSDIHVDEKKIADTLQRHACPHSKTNGLASGLSSRTSNECVCSPYQDSLSDESIVDDHWSDACNPRRSSQFLDRLNRVENVPSQISSFPQTDPFHLPNWDDYCSRSYAHECSEALNQSFNRDEPELILYSCRSCPEISSNVSQTQFESLAKEAETMAVQIVCESVCTDQTGSVLKMDSGGNLLSQSPFQRACSVSQFSCESVATSTVFIGSGLTPKNKIEGTLGTVLACVQHEEVDVTKRNASGNESLSQIEFGRQNAAQQFVVTHSASDTRKTFSNKIHQGNSIFSVVDVDCVQLTQHTSKQKHSIQDVDSKRNQNVRMDSTFRQHEGYAYSLDGESKCQTSSARRHFFQASNYACVSDTTCGQQPDRCITELPWQCDRRSEEYQTVFNEQQQYQEDKNRTQNKKNPWRNLAAMQTHNARLKLQCVEDIANTHMNYSNDQVLSKSLEEGDSYNSSESMNAARHPIDFESTVTRSCCSGSPHLSDHLSSSNEHTCTCSWHSGLTSSYDFSKPGASLEVGTSDTTASMCSFRSSPGYMIQKSAVHSISLTNVCHHGQRQMCSLCDPTNQSFAVGVDEPATLYGASSLQDSKHNGTTASFKSSLQDTMCQLHSSHRMLSLPTRGSTPHLLDSHLFHAKEDTVSSLKESSKSTSSDRSYQYTVDPNSCAMSGSTKAVSYSRDDTTYYSYKSLQSFNGSKDTCGQNDSPYTCFNSSLNYPTSSSSPVTSTTTQYHSKHTSFSAIQSQSDIDSTNSHDDSITRVSCLTDTSYQSSDDCRQIGSNFFVTKSYSDLRHQPFSRSDDLHASIESNSTEQRHKNLNRGRNEAPQSGPKTHRRSKSFSKKDI